MMLAILWVKSIIPAGTTVWGSAARILWPSGNDNKLSRFTLVPVKSPNVPETFRTLRRYATNSRLRTNDRMKDESSFHLIIQRKIWDKMRSQISRDKMGWRHFSSDVQLKSTKHPNVPEKLEHSWDMQQGASEGDIHFWSKNLLKVSRFPSAWQSQCPRTFGTLMRCATRDVRIC